MYVTGLKAQVVMEIADNFFHCSLHLRKVSGDNKRTAETVHKSNVHRGAFERYVSSDHNSRE